MANLHIQSISSGISSVVVRFVSFFFFNFKIIKIIMLATNTVAVEEAMIAVELKQDI